MGVRCKLVVVGDGLCTYTLVWWGGDARGSHVHTVGQLEMAIPAL